MRKAGYAALKEMYGLPDIPHYVASCISAGARKSRDGLECYPPAYAPEDTLAGNLEFALKHEGVNLGILSALFKRADAAELRAYVMSRPTGIYTRRAWFFYEFLTGGRLDVPDLKSTCGYVDALDPARYVCRRGERLPRYRLCNNLAGTRDFCPLVRKTGIIGRSAWESLRDDAERVVQAYDAETVARAVNYLYTKETRSSFAIEHEDISGTRMERFGRALQSVRSYPVLNKQALVDQQGIMLDPKAAATDYRSEQSYVGETLGRREVIHFVSPKPEDLPGLMAGLLSFLENAADMDPVVVAAVASFGFVFIHPFDDGNGRTHRYIIHHVLANRGVTPQGVIFPVSATMLNNIRDYDACLESFSRPVMRLVEYRMNEEGSMEVLNDTADLYRYFDATPMAEYLYDCIAKTIEVELKAELETVSAFARAKDAFDAQFDLPDKRRNLFLKLCWQGKGELSRTKRARYFADYSDEEIESMRRVVQPFFAANRKDITS